MRSVEPIASVSRFENGLNLNVSSNCIEIVQFNANSLLGHIDLIRTHLDSHFYHIISISETWLHSGISDDMVRLGDFLLIRNDRERRRGGGVACYVHRSFSVKLLASSPSVFSNSPEFLILELSCPGAESLLFISMYRRPETILFNDFFNVFSRYSFAYKNIIVGGDLNCNLPGSGFEAASLRESDSSFALNIVDSDPTYHTAAADSWLDVFIIDSSDKVQSFRKSEAPFIAGHDLLEMSYRFESPPNPVRTIVHRSFGRFNDSAFLDCSGRVLDEEYPHPLEGLSSSVEIDSFLESLRGAIVFALDNQAPLRSFPVRRPEAPWLFAILRARIRERNYLFRRAKRSGSILALAEYRHYRDVLVIDLRRAQSDHCLERLRGLSDLGKLWRELASAGLVRPSCMSPLNFFTADELNLFFASVSCASSACLAADLATALDFPLPSRPIFMFSNVSSEHVSQIILSITSPPRTAGPDSVSLFSIHKALPRLALLFNACLKLGHFPSSWKRAFVRPLLKENPPSSPVQ